MKVRDLMKQLEAQNPGADVICYTEDEAFLGNHELFRVLEIDSIEAVNAEKCRDETDKPTLKLGRSGASDKHVLINVTGIF